MISPYYAACNSISIRRSEDVFTAPTAAGKATPQAGEEAGPGAWGQLEGLPCSVGGEGICRAVTDRLVVCKSRQRLASTSVACAGADGEYESQLVVDSSQQ